MVRAVEVTGASGPRTSPGKDRHKDQKKRAGDLKPENATGAAEGVEECARAAAHGLPSSTCRLRSLNRRVDWRLSGGAVTVHETLDQRPGNSRSLTDLTGGRGLRADRQVMAGHAPNDAHSNTQGAANDARSHSNYDGSSGSWRLAPWQRFPSCSQAGLAVR